MLRKLAIELILSVASTVLSRSLYIISAILLARGWGATEAGHFGLVQATIVMLSSVASQATSMGAATHLSNVIRHGAKPTLLDLRAILIFAGVVATTPYAVFMICPEWSSESLVGYGDSRILHAVALIIIAGVILGVINGALTALGRFREQMIANATAVIPSLALLVFATQRYGTEGAVWALCAGSFLQLATAFHALLKGLRDSQAEPASAKYTGAQAVRNLWLVTIPVLFTGAMVAPTGWIATRITNEWGGGLQQVGYYAAGSQILAIFSQLSVVLAVVLVPRLARIGRISAHHMDTANMLSGWLAVSACAFPLIVWPELASSLLGGTYTSSDFHHVVQYLSAASVLMAFKGGIGRKVVANSFAWFSVASNALWLAAFSALAWFLAPHGAQGVALAFLIAHVLHFIGGLPFFARRGLMHWRYIISPGGSAIWISAILIVCVGCLAPSDGWRVASMVVALVGTLLGARLLIRNDEVEQ